MDYEKKYNEILAWAKKYKARLNGVPIEDIFPELRESEDEIHRKWILEYLYDGLRKTDEQFKDHFKSAIDWLEKQKEQNPNIELIQHSWYMEGYHDREFGQEPKWIMKTGKGGPKYELNPKYGQPLAKEQKPAWSEEDIEKMVSARARKSGATNAEMQFYRQGIEDTLKSLRPSWKPSEEQEEPEYYQHFDPDC